MYCTILVQYEYRYNILASAPPLNKFHSCSSIANRGDVQKEDHSTTVSTIDSRSVAHGKATLDRDRNARPKERESIGR